MEPRENKEVSITLPAMKWNVVLHALAQRPFAEVADLIVEVKAQAEKALADEEKED